MTADELREELATGLRYMSSEERAKFVTELYAMDIMSRRHVRRLLGISDEDYLKTGKSEYWYDELRYRFNRLSDEFLSRKYMEQMKDSGEY